MTERSPELDLALERFGRPDAGEQLARANEERERVVADFPVESWPELPLERYAMGTDVADAPFCTVMEYRTPYLGSIKGGSARKHIIYRASTGSWWLAGPLEHLDPHDAWARLRREFVTGIHAVQEGDLDTLDTLPLLRWGPALVTKTLATYAPDTFLRVYSGDHIRRFIRLFGGEPLPNVPSWELNRQLKHIIENDPDVGSWDQEEVLSFLYTRLDPRQDGDEIIKIAPGDRARLWDECLRNGVIRIGFDPAGDLSQYTGTDGLLARLREADPGKSESYLRGLARQLLRFRDLPPGSRIVANRGGSEILGVGTVTEEGYRHDPDLPEYRNVLGVDWDTSYAQRLDPPVKGWVSTFGKVSPRLWTRIQQGRTITGGKSTPDQHETTLPADVSKVLAALDRKGQVILYGPPGTGKTRLALSAALALNGHAGTIDAGPAERGAALRTLLDDAPSSEHGDSPVTVTTFHPSLGYEDFVEGYKPRDSGEAGLSLRLTDGLFTRICSAAEADAERTYLLVIDEINRADLPRVLGELITLLEPDKRGMPVRLPISGRPFRVPGNLRIIGTMNTADRSVAHLDAAIRRRFGFVEVAPDPTTIDGAVGALDLSAFLTALNERISSQFDRDRQIGHAFLLHDDVPVESPDQLSSAFYHDIVPLLEDYALGDAELLTRLLGADLVDPDSGQVAALDPDDLTVTLAKEFAAGIATDADTA
jgi:5-methylcytosine-specific restriction protein B